MDCKNALAKLFDYLDNELDAPDAEELAQHLELCRKCYDRAEFERLLKARIREKTCSCQPPEKLTARIRDIMDKMCPEDKKD